MALPLSEDHNDELSDDHPVREGYSQLNSNGVSEEPTAAEPSAGRIININGMEVHVYGQLAGLQLSDLALLGNQNDSNKTKFEEREDDNDDEEDERERKLQEDLIVQADLADQARRSAPLPPERCQAIKNAMQGISLGDFRPSWANNVPEQEWIDSLKSKLNSKNPEA